MQASRALGYGSSPLAYGNQVFSRVRVVDSYALFAFVYAFWGANLVVSFGISDHDGQDGEHGA